MVTEVIRKHRVYKRNVYISYQEVKQIRAEAALNGCHLGLFDILWTLSLSFDTREQAEKECAELNQLMVDNGCRTFYSVFSFENDQIIEHNGGFLAGGAL